MNCELKKYFPEITDEQAARYEMLESLYPEWNEKINVISRADIGELVVRHILHSLAIAKFNLLEQSHNILDVGTGGGFPGIPLAIMYPDKKFTLIDSIGKKITVVNDVIARLGLQNARGILIFIVSRQNSHDRRKIEQLSLLYERQANTDELTGLYNRRYFNNFLKLAILY